MPISSSGMSYQRQGEGYPLLLLHGIPGSGASWHAVATRLDRGFDLIIPDLLGFGGSVRPDALGALHANGQAAALASLIDELGISQIAVAGHDFGGPVAIRLQAVRPQTVTHLALYSTNTFTNTPIPFPLSLVAHRTVGELAARVLFSRPSLRMMLWAGRGRPRQRVDAQLYLGDAGQVRSIRTIFAGSLQHLKELYTPIEAQLSKITVPRAVGWGTRDPFFSVEQGTRTAAALGAHLQLFEGAGHFLPDERADDIALHLRNLVARSGDAKESSAA